MAEESPGSQPEEIKTNPEVTYPLDALTGLPTRGHLMEALRRDVVSRPGNFALGFLDVDGLKQVNDRHGHKAGDELIKQTAAVLVDGVRTHEPQNENQKRPADMVARSVFRLGGDEFVIKLASVSSQAEVDKIMSRLQGDLKDKRIDASIYGRPHRAGESGEKLLDDVDHQMLAQKRARRRQELMSLTPPKFWAFVGSELLARYSGAERQR